MIKEDVYLRLTIVIGAIFVGGVIGLTRGRVDVTMATNKFEKYSSVVAKGYEQIIRCRDSIDDKNIQCQKLIDSYSLINRFEISKEEIDIVRSEKTWSSMSPTTVDMMIDQVNKFAVHLIKTPKTDM